ncbi:hypothetical protein RISK_004729 [Rhodopirellula islandica]|uniref:Uncharacterized protein n=1 Tax=Rhodopirellula islandica TaxID=595434 RepID=A0A0J1B9M6_RHOIS|nr:hypothetical protein RISK_004729 [Rhodopirellula islandica]
MDDDAQSLGSIGTHDTHDVGNADNTLSRDQVTHRILPAPIFSVR